MKLYKYRDLTNPGLGLSLVRRILQTQSFWCARPDTLNDPEEFAWSCNYMMSPYTEELLAHLLVEAKGRTEEQARLLVAAAVNGGRLRNLSEPVVDSLIKQCREDIGLACFGSAPDNEVLWDRYAGGGCGLCVEVDVPNGLMGAQLHRVQYWDRKLIHVDTFLRSRFDREAASEFYVLSLLSKPKSWEPEGEIRFVSKKQSVNVAIKKSQITRVILGDALPSDLRARVRELALSIPVADRVRATTA